MTTKHLVRIRRAVRAVLVLGVAASLAANVLHAQDSAISRIIAAWPPLALLLTVELISRVPVHRRSLAAVRIGATTTIAGIAAWVSYWHMVAVSARYGETGASPYLLPLSVDGLVIVASVSLVELGGQIRALQADTRPADIPAPDTVRTPVVARPVTEEDTADAAALAPVIEELLPLPGEDTELEIVWPARTRRSVLPDAAVAALALRADNPAMTQEAIAEQVGRSVRQVRRYLNETAEATA